MINLLFILFRQSNMRNLIVRPIPAIMIPLIVLLHVCKRYLINWHLPLHTVNSANNHIYQSIMVKAGCQPPWRLVSVQNLPLCDNLNMLMQYNSIFVRLVYYGRNKLIEATKCLMPCTYMEYKVCTKTCKTIAVQSYQ